MVSLLSAAGMRAQQHGFTSGDVEEGGRMYRRMCIGCHGGEGASVSGIDLARGKFRTASTDEDLVKVILNGVPGTGMPPTTMAPVRAGMIVGYLRSLGATPRAGASMAAASGDASRGRSIFFASQVGCSGCHRVRGEGGRSGPDLSEAGHLMRKAEIEAAIVDPDAQYPAGTRPVRAIRKTGAPVTGLLLNQDTYSIQVLDQEGRLRSLDRGELASVSVAPSWMPSYKGKLSPQELADLIAYIGSLKLTP